MIIQQKSRLVLQFFQDSKICPQVLSWYSKIVKVAKFDSWITRELVLYSKLLKMEFDSWLTQELVLQSKVRTVCRFCSESTKILTAKSSTCRIIDMDSIIFIEE